MPVICRIVAIPLPDLLARGQKDVPEIHFDTPSFCALGIFLFFGGLLGDNNGGGFF